MLPVLNENGDLPPGVHVAQWVEIENRFGRGARERARALATLKHLHELASRTASLRNFYVFGSFVSAAPEPRDIAGRHASWHIGGRMIRNDQELGVTRERVAKLERLLEELRRTARPEEWPELSSGYRREIERMQGEILDYLVQGDPGKKRTTTA